MLETTVDVWRVRDFVVAMAGGVMLAVVVGIPTVGGSPSVFLVSAALAQYLGHFTVTWWLSRRRGGLGSLGFRIEGRDGIWLLAGLTLQLLVPLLFLPFAELVSQGEGGQVIGEALHALDTPASRWVMALTIGFFAPVAEELMFRGILLRALLATRARSAPWITAGVFAVFHIFGLGGDLSRALIVTMPPFFVIGLILAYLTIRRQRLGPAIFVHAGFNLLALFVVLLPPEILEEALRQATTTTAG